MSTDTEKLTEALAAHQHVRHRTTIHGFTTCACICGVLTECGGPLGWFGCEKGHAEHVVRDVLAGWVSPETLAEKVREAKVSALRDTAGIETPGPAVLCNAPKDRDDQWRACLRAVADRIEAGESL